MENTRNDEWLEMLERLEARIEMIEPGSIVILGGALPATVETMLLMDKYGIDYVTDDTCTEACEKLSRFRTEIAGYFGR